jgi:hypothetical protein
MSDEIKPASHKVANTGMALVAKLMERVRAIGPMRKAPMGFVLTLMNSVAESTIDFMARDRTNAKKHCRVGFDALWRMVF